MFFNQPKRAWLLVGLISTLALVLVPSASAAWSHEGTELTENRAVTLEGEIEFTGGIGSVRCTTSIGATLFGNSSEGQVTSFSVAEPAKCDLGGLLKATCGTNGLTSVAPTGTWEVTQNAEEITLRTAHIHYFFKGCAIPSIQIEGDISANPVADTAVGLMTLGGAQTAFNAEGGSLGPVEAKGSLTMSPSATYGIDPPTKWQHSGVPLQAGENPTLTLEGSLAYTTAMGAFVCPVTIDTTLTGETHNGHVNTFAVETPKCHVSGSLAFLAGGTNSVTTFDKTGAWNVKTLGPDIGISSIQADLAFASGFSLVLSGKLTLVLNNPSSISTVSVSGSWTSNLGSTFQVAGSLAATPAGTYGVG